jgi:hypothetical protein
MDDTRWWSDTDVLRSGELGLYDFADFVYYLAAQDDPEAVDITARHEYLHHFLTVSTNYGSLLARTRKELNESDDERDRRLFRALAGEAVLVSEMVATYASLTWFPSSRLMMELPAAYRAAYDRCASIVEEAFHTPLLREAYAIGLGRCLMMVSPSETEVHALRVGELPSVPASSSPERCLEVVERHSGLSDAVRRELRGWFPDDGSGEEAQEAADVFADAQAETAALERLLGQQSEEPDAAFLESTLHRLLAEHLDSIIPGLDDAAAEFRLVRGAGLIDRSEHVRDLGVAETARHLAQQRIAVWQRSPRNTHVNERPAEDLASVGETGIDASWTQSVYCYLQQPDEALEVLLLGLRWSEDPVTLSLVSLDVPEIAALPHWPGPLITIADQALLPALEQPLDESLASLLRRGCFVHVVDNPVDFVVRAVSAGRNVVWVYGGVGYQTDDVGETHGLQLVVYTVEGFPYRLFHLGNPMVTAALELVTDRAVANPEKLRQLRPEDSGELADFGSDLFSPLIDHPLVLAFLRVGERLPSDLRQLAESTAGEPAEGRR